MLNTVHMAMICCDRLTKIPAQASTISSASSMHLELRPDELLTARSNHECVISDNVSRLPNEDVASCCN
ncbi:hypothetical protein Y032_0332g2769 [Ancylostoma ceylanicum]|uniref:Uncharacterized protein n=1 Tax=Ancylostoma ceylanicum TaxID=53326 RepID=A0A016RZD8_9BILA|nr:hypothetical protein Y032_0332g2769 [Ancylostoma ceylanicum]